MPDYQNGKVYAIRSHQTDKVYVGSTTSPLSLRMAKHRSDTKNNSNNTSSKEIMKYGDAYIELLEAYPCSSKEELNRKEGEFIRTLDCINKRIEGRTRKEYRCDNKELISKLNADYYNKNKEYRKTVYNVEYYQKNKERLKAYQNEYNRAKKNEN